MAGGRALRIDWQEDAATVGAAYRAERSAEVRPRLQALWLVRQGRSLGDTAAVVGVHYRTLQTWLGWYRQGGLAAVGRHHQAGRGRASWLSAAQQAELLAEAARGSFFTAQDAQAWVAGICTGVFGVGARAGRAGVGGRALRSGVHPQRDGPALGPAPMPSQSPAAI